MDRFVYFFYLNLCRLIAALPLGFVYRFGAMLGGLTYWTLGSYRRLVLENLTLAFGDEKSPQELRRLARRHFIQLGANFFSSVKGATMSQEAIRKHVHVEGAELLLEVAKNPVGAIGILSHLGNWEALAQITPLIYPGKTGTVFQSLSNPYIDAHVRASRARLGMEPMARKEGFNRAVALLREGALVGVLVDQHAGNAGVWCPLFGRLASTSPLAATLSLRTGASLLLAAVFTESPGYWRMVIEKPDLPATRNPAQLTAEINRVLEAQIRRAPEDWFWVHNRWKTPKPNFLLGSYKRGIALPAGFDAAQLKPFRIVVRSSNWLGDAVMTTPAVQAVKRGRPDAHVTVLVKAKLADYWRRIPEVDEVLCIEPDDSVFSVARKLRAGRFEAAVILPNSIRSALEPWLAGIPRRFGYAAKGRSWLLTAAFRGKKRKKNEPPHPARHQVYHYLELAEWLGADIGAPGLSDFFPRPARPADPAKPLKIGLCPGAEYGPAKRWMPERFAQAANAVSAKVDCEWVLFGVGGDAPIGDAIAGQLTGSHTNLIGKTSLAELMDRISECACLLTNDTGTMHLAAALGVPVVAVFGSTEPQLTAPLGPGHRVLRHQVECSPCFLRECPLDFRCMEAVTAEEAAQAVLETLPSQSA
ncbi:MAG: lipopolysaccharide heptosyltransferase II [Chthoniobacteraceae bacterium]|nr:lipopolysaccharide heptosyltransferase II [Chthoniobacteraceae bacterium]